MKKPHLYFRNAVEGVEKYRSRTRYPGRGDEDEKEVEKNYDPMRDEWTQNLTNFYNLKSQKSARRNRSFNVPAEIDYLILEFFDVFDSPGFENKYINEFGLEPVRFEAFNTVGYFAVVDEELFRNFIEDLNKFINNKENYNPNIKYIRRFDFLSFDKILNISEDRQNFTISLLEPLYVFSNKVLPVLRSLEEFLKDNSIQYSLDIPASKMELFNCSQELIKEVVDNFDVIQSVKSPLAGIIRPSPFSQPIRDFGFNIGNASKNLPLVAVLDTGISSRTPLAPIIINIGNEFDITNTSPLVDEADHGTGVAALAALGRSLYPDHTGTFNADAKLLSIKILSATEGYISQSRVEALIREAHSKYGTKIFVLTIGYDFPLNNCDPVSNYAFMLDKLSYQLDILIFISTGNAYGLKYCLKDTNSDEIKPYPIQFDNPAFNICAPAESYNNITCGAIADNFENYNINCYSTDKNFPASYTRKFNIPRDHDYRKKKRISTQLVKPDLVCAGGDSERDLQIRETGLKYLSSIDGHYFDKWIGTSYSAPLAANVAAKLLKEYPTLGSNLQSLKALIINGCKLPGTGDSFNNLKETRVADLVGKGNPDESSCLYSDENRITMVLEDSITPDEIKVYPLQLPKYLCENVKNKSLIEVNATLCYKFNPVPNNQMCYLPVHISFGIFRNKPIVQKVYDSDGKEINTGINNNTTDEIKFSQSWSEDYYYKAKMLSNCHKQRFFISRDNLISEKNIFKISVKCKIHKLLSNKQEYMKEHPFSIVISLRENLSENKLTNQLYNEMILINVLEVIGELHAEADLENNS